MFSRLKAMLEPTTQRGKRAAVGAGFLLIAMLGSVSIFATGPSAVPEERTEKAWPVAVVEVSPAPIRPTFTAYGRVESSTYEQLQN